MDDKKKSSYKILRFVLLLFICMCCGFIAILSYKPTRPTSTIAATVAPAASVSTTALNSTPASTTDVPAPILPPLGESRTNPLSAGIAVDIGGGKMLTVTGATLPADSIVKKGNLYNATPEPNLEYLLIDVQIVCNKSSNDTCSFFSPSIKAVGADGNVHETEMFMAGVAGLIESGDFFGGATRSGKMLFLIPKDDKSVVLFYEPVFGSSVYFSIP